MRTSTPGLLTTFVRQALTIHPWEVFQPALHERIHPAWARAHRDGDFVIEVPHNVAVKGLTSLPVMAQGCVATAHRSHLRRVRISHGHP